MRMGYWQSYKEIEEQILLLSRSIEFDDDNFDGGVHSVRIANLILQCAANVESVLKDIYIKECSEGEKHRRGLYYDYDCLVWLINEWDLKERTVHLNGVFNVRKDANRCFCPFDNHGKTKVWRGRTVPSWAWNEAYQSIKHDYLNSIAKDATLKVLVEIAALLYALNLYYYNFSLTPRIQITGYCIDITGTMLDSELFELALPEKDEFESEKKIIIVESGDFENNGWQVTRRWVVNKGNKRQ